MTEKKETKSRLFRGVLPEEAVEHLSAARKEWRKSIESLFPERFVTHRRAAQREMLLAVRSVIDAALERVEAKATE